MTVNDQCERCERGVNPGYRLCIGCERRCMKVYDDCIRAGLSDHDANCRVEEAYPSRVVGVDVVRDRSGRRFELHDGLWRRS